MCHLIFNKFLRPLHFSYELLFCPQNTRVSFLFFFSHPTFYLLFFSLSLSLQAYDFLFSTVFQFNLYFHFSLNIFFRILFHKLAFVLLIIHFFLFLFFIFLISSIIHLSFPFFRFFSSFCSPFLSVFIIFFHSSFFPFFSSLYVSFYSYFLSIYINLFPSFWLSLISIPFFLLLSFSAYFYNFLPFHSVVSLICIFRSIITLSRIFSYISSLTLNAFILFTPVHLFHHIPPPTPFPPHLKFTHEIRKEIIHFLTSLAFRIFIGDVTFSPRLSDASSLAHFLQYIFSRRKLKHTPNTQPPPPLNIFTMIHLISSLFPISQ